MGQWQRRQRRRRHPCLPLRLPLTHGPRLRILVGVAWVVRRALPWLRRRRRPRQQQQQPTKQQRQLLQWRRLPLESTHHHSRGLAVMTWSRLAFYCLTFDKPTKVTATAAAAAAATATATATATVTATIITTASSHAAQQRAHQFHLVGLNQPQAGEVAVAVAVVLAVAVASVASVGNIEEKSTIRLTRTRRGRPGWLCLSKPTWKWRGRWQPPI